jgi:RimJ/RimL family protein N-acetyltransferase
MLRTARLDLIPSTLEHLTAELQDPNGLGTFLGVPVPGDWPPGDYDRDAIEYFREQLEAGGPGLVGWYGWYAVTHGADGCREALVACGGYFGPPEDGVVELGYSVVPSARRKGYATELVGALVARLLEQPGVDSIIAHTEDANLASTRVLLGCGFRRVRPEPDSGLILYRYA